jgi:hypothetical protein
MSPRKALCGAVGLLAACVQDGEREPSGDSAESARASPVPAASADSVATCFVSDRSVLARGPGSPAPGSANVTGWIRLDRFGIADSAPAKLIDSDGFALDAAWRRSADSLMVAGFNDFVRVEMRLRVTESSATGSLRAHSDAALERDSAGQLREFRRTMSMRFREAPCDSMPGDAGTAAIDVLPDGSPRPGIRFNPSTIRPGTTVGTLVLDSIIARQAVIDAINVGSARFRGEIELSGWTLRNPDPDLGRILTCFEADSSSAARLPRWAGDERRAWFCFSNRAEAARALGPPSEGVRARIVIDQFTIHAGMSDEVNSARFIRLVRRGPPR